MHSNTVPTSLRNALSLAELPSYLSGWGTFRGSYFVAGSCRISDCCQECLVVSRAGLCVTDPNLEQGK